ncbi:MAG: hypothetical protein A2144_09480 [Chloroflexi bacterium RBG_16_50_9]|nr:MAG: hypothetical protein A2144_09480 [Chloroflexi bacterium RBG_16_50_9]
MGKLPRLRVEGLGWEALGGAHDFEEARRFPYGQNVMVVVEGHVIGSYEELALLAAQPEFRNREFLEVKFLEYVVGG